MDEITNRTTGFELLLVESINRHFIYYDYAKKMMFLLQPDSEEVRETFDTVYCGATPAYICENHPGCCRIWGCNDDIGPICPIWIADDFERIKWDSHVNGEVFFQTLDKLKEYVISLCSKEGGN